MLDSILCNKDALNSMSFEPINEQVKQNISNETDWIFIEKIGALLGPLKDLTESLNASSYVTVSLLFPALFCMINYTYPEFEFSLSLIQILKSEHNFFSKI